MLVKYLKEDTPWQDQSLGEKRQEKSICIVRYGGFGDMIQMSSVLPWLKQNGWYVTLNTTDTAFNIVKNDPNIDEVFLQKTDQVPNKELLEYWNALSKHFTKFVQFSESIEGSLLALPYRKEYEWKTKRRHQAMNKDYFQQMHDIADVPMPPRPKFYPTPEEERKADLFMEEHSDSFIILWALCGSSVHKVWPYTDNVVAQLMVAHPNVKIVFVGDLLCQLLEDPWRNEKRVIPQSGRMGIRDSLTLSQKVHMVIGPETGILNCVAFEKKIPKIIFLSHSSPVNIGGNWKNTVALKPFNVDCYPCHKLHYGWKTCNRDLVTGGAMCAANITPDRVYNAIVPHIQKRMAA